MIRTILWFIYFWIYLFCTVPALIKANRLIKRDGYAAHKELVEKTASRWAAKLIKFSGTTVKVIGQENLPKDRAVLFVSNHQGNFDIPLLMSHLDKTKGFISKVEIKKMPIIRKWMENMQCVFIDRKDMRQSVRCINEGIEILKNGQSMVIFPEGTRSKGGPMKEFKPGSFKLAIKSEVPIVPITIKGSYKMFEERGSKVTPAEVEIIISEPIETKGISSKEDQIELTTKVYEMIKSKL